jgi:hypothetical protein
MAAEPPAQNIVVYNFILIYTQSIIISSLKKLAANDPDVSRQPITHHQQTTNFLLHSFIQSFIRALSSIQYPASKHYLSYIFHQPSSISYFTFNQ